jgi:hypothetical protein
LGISSRPPREFSLTSAGTKKPGQVKYPWISDYQKKSHSSCKDQQSNQPAALQFARLVENQTDEGKNDSDNTDPVCE